MAKLGRPVFTGLGLDGNKYVPPNPDPHRLVELNTVTERYVGALRKKFCSNGESAPELEKNVNDFVNIVETSIENLRAYKEKLEQRNISANRASGKAFAPVPNWIERVKQATEAIITATDSTNEQMDVATNSLKRLGKEMNKDSVEWKKQLRSVAGSY